MERCQDETVYEGDYEEPIFFNIASFRAHYGSCYKCALEEEIGRLAALDNKDDDTKRRWRR